MNIVLVQHNIEHSLFHRELVCVDACRDILFERICFEIKNVLVTTSCAQMSLGMEQRQMQMGHVHVSIDTNGIALEQVVKYHIVHCFQILMTL